MNGSTITDAETEELEDVLVEAAFGPSNTLDERGKAIDGLLGVVSSHREGFFD